MPDVSSTEAREAARRGDRKALLQVLHPDVATWVLSNEAATVACAAAGHLRKTPLQDAPREGRRLLAVLHTLDIASIDVRVCTENDEFSRAFLYKLMNFHVRFCTK